MFIINPLQNHGVRLGSESAGLQLGMSEKPVHNRESTGPAPIFKDRQDHAFPVIPSAAEGSAELSTRISPLAPPGRNDRPAPAEQQGPSGPHRSVSEASGRKPKQLPAVRGFQEPENKGKRFLHTPDYLDAEPVVRT